MNGMEKMFDGRNNVAVLVFKLNLLMFLCGKYGAVVFFIP